MEVKDIARVDLEVDERKRFIDCALSYLGTPYHHEGRIKGVGVDCATFLICAGHDAGLIENIPLPHYSPQWMLHRGEEVYLRILSSFCREVERDKPLPGDICLWKVARTFSHSAIVIEWPKVIHAVIGTNVRTDDFEKTMWLRFDGIKPRAMKLFSYWG